MSNDEKAVQIGQAVTEYMAAKAEVARIDAKVMRIMERYRRVGEAVMGLIEDRGEAISRMNEANKQMSSFGITDLE